MAWIPFDQRPVELRQQLEEKLASVGNDQPVFDYYNSNDLGLISEEALIKHIQGTTSAVSDSNLVDIKQEDISESNDSKPMNEGDAFTAKSLRFLKSNANTAEERRFAETIYYDILLDLWRQHVMQTGETYYPPLAEDLFELYRFNQDQS